MKFMTALMKDGTYSFVGIDNDSGGYMYKANSPSYCTLTLFEFWKERVEKGTETTKEYKVLFYNELVIDKQTGESHVNRLV